jgi:hypothetical protein
MSHGSSCVLDWTEADLERVRAAIEEAIAECARATPEYAGSRIQVGDGTIHVFFPRALVEKPGWELTRPFGGGPGGYHCTFDHTYHEPMPQHGIPGEATVSITSKRNDNQKAWGTATRVLARVTALLGGTIRET